MTNEKQEALRAQFEEWLVSKSLNAIKDVDVWGQTIYKFPHIEAMWYAWKGHAALTEAPKVDVEELKRDVFMNAEAGIDISPEAAAYAVEYLTTHYDLVKKEG